MHRLSGGTRALLIATAFGFSATVLGVADPFAWPAVWVLVTCGLVLSITDLRHGRLPFALSVPATVAFVMLLALPAGAHHEWSRWWLTLACAAAVGGFFVVLALVMPAGIGGGDIVVSPLIGAALGWFGGFPLVATGLAVAVITAALAGALGLLVFHGRRHRGRHAGPASVPFGPFLFLGVAVAAIAGPALIHAYLALAGID